jgi:hypothetical protein
MMRLALAVSAAVGISLATAGVAAAADDYTLPFTNPQIVLSYGVDRDARVCRQLDWANQAWADCALHWGRSYDNHTGQDYPMASGTEVVAARDGVVVGIVEGHPSTPGPWGNYVLVEHSDGRRTLYYHLANQGVIPSLGQGVTAGQTIGSSACSGNCHGDHLHFELLTRAGSAWRSTDPHFERRWTTWPARVPYLARYVRESTSSTVVVRQGQTIGHWVEFRNDGGRQWRSDVGTRRLMLATWNPALHTSAFRAGDWPSGTVATNLDQVAVNPGGIGRYTFGIRGGPVPGYYAEWFNLLAQRVMFFDHARLGGYHVPIRVSNFQP